MRSPLDDKNQSSSNSQSAIDFERHSSELRPHSSSCCSSEPELDIPSSALSIHVRLRARRARQRRPRSSRTRRGRRELFVDEEDDANVGRHVDEVGAHALIKSARAFHPMGHREWFEGQGSGVESALCTNFCETFLATTSPARQSQFGTNS